MQPSPLNSKIAFNIGWDYYTYRIGLPEHAEQYPPIMEGYNEARKRVHTHENDRFIRKQLQLRFNAWRRNRVFDERVTPEFIRMIDVQRCPITWEPLTHGTIQGSDWSVDRIHNDCAYACGNLVVVSTRANRLKAAKTYEEIYALSMESENTLEPTEPGGLNSFQWRRWLFISSLIFPAYRDNGDVGFDYSLAPCVMRPPPATMLNPSCLLQMALANKVSKVADHRLYHIVLAALPPYSRSAFIKLSQHAERVKRRMMGRPLDIWHNMALFVRFADFYATLSEEQQIHILEVAGRDILSHLKMGIDPRRVNMLDPSEWHIETGGYMSSINLR
ncbi:MAG TPA: hypothetical protein VFF74_04375 [Methylophilaceae bacterium]|nr:hypothetical protein [Methylophilaceae bacterium]